MMVWSVLFWSALWRTAQGEPTLAFLAFDEKKLRQVESLSTSLKSQYSLLSGCLNPSKGEPLPMLKIESSMMELENLVMQLEEQISTLTSPSSP